MRATGGHAHRPHLFAKTGWQAIQECVAQKCHRQGHTQQSSGLPQACLARPALQPCAGAQDKVFLQGGILQGAQTNGKTPYPERPRKVAGPSEPDTPEVARSIAAYALDDGTFELRIPGLPASRFSRTNADGVHALQLPALCIIACTALPTPFLAAG